MGDRVFFFPLRVQSRDARESGRQHSRFGQVFVAVKTNRHSDPGFGAVARPRIFRRGCRSDDPQNTAPAADRHAFSQGDFGGHAEGELDFRADREGRVGEKEDATRAEILSKAETFRGGCGQAKRKREQIGKPLSHTAFYPNWRSGHKVAALPSLPNRRGERYALL